jgi:hypothetical protein
MKQTAVEWLYELSKKRELDKFDLQQAKAMEKEQIVKAYESLEFDVSSNEVVICPLCDGRDEYIKTETGYECAFTDCMHQWAK